MSKKVCSEEWVEKKEEEKKEDTKKEEEKTEDIIIFKIIPVNGKIAYVANPIKNYLLIYCCYLFVP